MEFHVQEIPSLDRNVVRCEERSNVDQGCGFCLCAGGYAFVGTILQVLEI